MQSQRAPLMTAIIARLVSAAIDVFPAKRSFMYI